MAQAVDIRGLEELARTVLAGLGYDLVELEWKHEAGHWVLRVLIDHPWRPGQPPDAVPPVSLDDCTRASRSLGAEIDVAEAIHVPFNLEVSSPGINRPLKREDDFRRFAGQKAKVRTRAPVPDPGAPPGAAPRRNFAGRLVRAESGHLTLDVEGRLVDIPVTDVERANLVYDFQSPGAGRGTAAGE